jgi:hypothetical protein
MIPDGLIGDVEPATTCWMITGGKAVAAVGDFSHSASVAPVLSSELSRYPDKAPVGH